MLVCCGGYTAQHTGTNGRGDATGSGRSAEPTRGNDACLAPLTRHLVAASRPSLAASEDRVHARRLGVRDKTCTTAQRQLLDARARER